MRARIPGGLALLLAMAMTAGCGGRAPQPEAPGDAAASVGPGLEEPAPARAVGVSREEQYWLPPLFRTPEDEVHYYLSRLADRRFVTYYGGAEHPRPWYIAAERLGQLGEPAIPLLVARLDSDDPFELMLALYALQLASQDPALMARTGGDYVELDGVLTEESNAENRATALGWWERHGYLWQ